MPLPLASDHKGVPRDKDSLRAVLKILREEDRNSTTWPTVRARDGRRGEKLPVREEGSPAPNIDVGPVRLLEKSHASARSG